MALRPQEQFYQRVSQLSPLLQDHVEEIVKKFDKVIDSKRRSSTINSFDELVVILIKRDLIDPDIISTWLRLDLICLYYVDQPFHEPAIKPSAGVQQQPSNQTTASVSNYPPDDIRQEEIDYLSSRISFSWRSFARGLKLTVSEIDLIEQECQSNYSLCVKKVIQVYATNRIWSSRSGDAQKDIVEALKLLRTSCYVEEFQRLNERLTNPIHK